MENINKHSIITVSDPIELSFMIPPITSMVFGKNRGIYPILSIGVGYLYFATKQLLIYCINIDRYSLIDKVIKTMKISGQLDMYQRNCIYRQI